MTARPTLPVRRADATHETREALDAVIDRHGTLKR